MSDTTETQPYESMPKPKSFEEVLAYGTQYATELYERDPKLYARLRDTFFQRAAAPAGQRWTPGVGSPR